MFKGFLAKLFKGGCGSCSTNKTGGYKYDNSSRLKSVKRLNSRVLSKKSRKKSATKKHLKKHSKKRLASKRTRKHRMHNKGSKKRRHR